MVDFNKLVGSITGSGAGAGLAGGVAGGALVTALSSKSGRKTAKSVAKIGGLAAVGALAWSAYKKYQGESASAGPAQIPVTPPRAEPVPEMWQRLPQEQFEVLGATGTESEGLLVLRAMIAAAMADGHLGPDEQAHIFERLDSLGLSAQERATLFDELRNPMTCDALAGQVRDPVTAIEIYTAAAMTVEGSCPAGKQFLGQLSTELNLPATLVASVQSNLRKGQLATA